MTCRRYSNRGRLESPLLFEYVSDSDNNTNNSGDSGGDSGATPLSSKLEVGTRIALILLELKSQIKMFHWQTTKLGQHYALDSLFTALTLKNDQWVETFQGKYGRIALTSSTATLTVGDSTVSSPESYLTEMISTLLEIQDAHFNTSVDSDLRNIFDEIVGVMWRTNYQLTLK